MLFMFFVALFVLHKTNAQLDLPPVVTARVRPEVYYNGYTDDGNDNKNRVNPLLSPADTDRSQRFGPPYLDDGNSDDRPDDFRNGQNNDDRQRYGYSYPRNNSGDSPFSYRDHYDPIAINRGLYGDQVNGNVDHNGDNRRYGISQIGNQSDPDRYNQRNQDDRGYQGYQGRDNPYDPLPIDGRNRFENAYTTTNQDRYNPDNRFNNDRQRYEQDRRYQIELEKLRNLLVESDHQATQECTANVNAQWNFETNVNPLTEAEALAAQQRYVEHQRLVAEQSKRIDKNLIIDRSLFRQLILQLEVGPNVLPLNDLDRYNRLINEQLILLNDATICGYQQPFKCNLQYLPDLKEIMSQSRDWEELQHTWVEYHRKVGREMRDSYSQLVDVMNEISSAHNATNAGEYWYMGYESRNFREDLDIVWEQIRPLYEYIHSYVRRKLREYYGPDRINRNAPIPEHILGNMFGQSWGNILDVIIPYPGKKIIDVTPRMIEQGYTPALMFQIAEEFFTSINMSALGADFYANSLFEQPIDRRVLCEPSAWDFCNRHDFRVKLCTEINQKSFISVHHELAHIQYFLQYRHLPKIFRNGANPAFHQAIGDAIALSVSTPKHFQTLGLLQRSVDDTIYDINYLFTMAIDKVVFLPFALALDNWRYDILSGKTSKKRLNCHYWDLREMYGGIKPPLLRSEEDFDVGAKYHVPANIPYIKYFVSTILQFQIYRAMCRAANQHNPYDPKKPLHKCDIYRQPEAGNLLKRIMAKGASQPWQEILEETIGEGRLDGSALREYFFPLEEWLRLESLRNQEYLGWNYDGDYCKRSLRTSRLEVFGGYYNAAMMQKWNVWKFIFCMMCCLALLLR